MSRCSSLKASKFRPRRFRSQFLHALELARSTGPTQAADQDRAKKIFYELARNGYAPAMFEVGQDNERHGNHIIAMDWYARGAMKHHLPSLHRVGQFLMSGTGCDRNEEDGIAALEAAALRGYTASQYHLGMLYKSGHRRNPELAFLWLRRAASGGVPSALNALAHCYSKGIGVAVDHCTAVQLYERSSAAGNVEAQYILGTFSLKGRGMAKDSDRGVALFTAAARAGHKEAQYHIGAFFYHGKHVARDPAAALMWLRKAADQGHTKSFFFLGTAYARGIGVAIDKALAVHWFSRGAEAGNGHCMNSLGVCYQKGEGVPADAAAAVRYYSMAAAKKEANGVYNLGMCMYKGKGMPQDLAAALMRFREAAELGHVNAMTQAGNCFMEGRGTARDRAKAIHFYSRAAAAGDVIATYNYAVALLKGNGTGEAVSEANKAQAIALLRRPSQAKHTPSLLTLGMVHLSNKGAPGNSMEEGIQCLLAAGELGCGRAYYELAVHHRRTNPPDNIAALRYYKAAADLGDVDAKFNLGVCYSCGIGGSVRGALARSLFQEAAAVGDVPSMMNLAALYASPVGGAIDLEQSEYWRRQAAMASTATPASTASAAAPGSDGMSVKVLEANVATRADAATPSQCVTGKRHEADASNCHPRKRQRMQ